VGPLLLVLLGGVALGAGWLAMHRLGPRVRVGRILASTPVVSVAEAKAAATAGHHRYVGVKGRIDSEQDFEDAAHRPLVLRRTRFEARQGRGWRVFEDQKELDHYWNKLTAGGDPKSQVCGWLKDKYGLSWQVVPRKMVDWFGEPNAKSERVMKALMQMGKLDIATLEKAYNG